MPAAKKPVGKITHFYSNIGVGVVKLNGILKQSDKIRVEGHGNSFEQVVDSMQVEHKKIKAAKKGQEIGLKFKKPVKEGDLVFKA